MASASSVVVSQLLHPAAISLRLQASQRDDILRELTDLVPQIASNEAARGTLHRALVEREKLHSTGVGDGVALPHARNALVGLVDQPVIAFGRHPEGVQFGSIDGRPTHLFLLLVAPTVTQHLAVLARLSRLLRDPALRTGLLQADRPDRVLQLFRDAEASL